MNDLLTVPVRAEAIPAQPVPLSQKLRIDLLFVGAQSLLATVGGASLLLGFFIAEPSLLCAGAVLITAAAAVNKLRRALWDKL